MRRETRDERFASAEFRTECAFRARSAGRVAFDVCLYYNSVMRDPNTKDTTISVRISGEEERVVRRYARRRRSSVSDVIRDAVWILVDQPAKDRPYDDMADLIGSVSGLPSDLSEGTGARFTEIVQEKAGRRR